MGWFATVRPVQGQEEEAAPEEEEKELIIQLRVDRVRKVSMRFVGNNLVIAHITK